MDAKLITIWITISVYVNLSAKYLIAGFALPMIQMNVYQNGVIQLITLHQVVNVGLFVIQITAWNAMI